MNVGIKTQPQLPVKPPTLEQKIVGQFERIRDVNEMMRFALVSLQNSDEHVPTRYHLKNFVVYCFSLTNVIQGLRSKVESFDAWWTPVFEGMRANGLARYFYLLRTEILKKNNYCVSFELFPRIPYRNLSLLRNAVGQAPQPGMLFQICSDGPRWILYAPDGVLIKTLPAKIPNEWNASSRLKFTDCPSAKFPTELAQLDISSVCAQHYDYLQLIVCEVHRRYWPYQSPST